MKQNAFCWLAMAYLTIPVSANYFFDNQRVNGLTKDEWFEKCRQELSSKSLSYIIFPIPDLCTQLRCIKDGSADTVSIGYDFCTRSSNVCEYPESSTGLPYPECCPTKQCRNGGMHDVMDFKTYMEHRTKQRQIKKY